MHISHFLVMEYEGLVLSSIEPGIGIGLISNKEMSTCIVFGEVVDFFSSSILLSCHHINTGSLDSAHFHDFVGLTGQLR
jgi:hypothetical protein